jgi:hypothetical protein
MYSLKISIFYLFLIFSSKLFSQQITNVDFSVTKENKMIVRYDLLNCPKNKMYNLKLKITSVNGKNIIPTTIQGDLINVKEGANKQIEWNVLNDVTDLKDDVYATIEITKSYYSKIVGGPSNVFFSMLLPGLGDIRVNKYSNNSKSNGWILVTGVFLGSAYYTYTLNNNYILDYSKYHSATVQSDMDSYFASASTNYNRYQIMVGVTGAIWIADLLYVTIKGFNNRKNQLYKRKNHLSQNTSNINLSVLATPSTFQLGLVKKF